MTVARIVEHAVAADVCGDGDAALVSDVRWFRLGVPDSCAKVRARVAQAGALTGAGCAPALFRLDAKSVVGCCRGGTVPCNDQAAVACTPVAEWWLLSAEYWRTGRMESSRQVRRIRDSRCAPGLYRVGHSGVRGRASEARDCRFRLQGECAADVQTSTLRQRPGCNGIRDIATVHERRMCRSSSNSLADAAM